MDPRVIYEIWAPRDGVWSPWAKPVLFAHLPESGDLPKVEIPELRLDHAPVATDRLAMVLDLPALESIGLGLELLRLGYRPVPLFNACPAPAALEAKVVRAAIASSEPESAPAKIETVPIPKFIREVVTATPLLSALFQATDQLKSARLPPGAPPAFLLDAGRLGVGRPIGPGSFDNRWVVFPTDFPSANFLFSQGVASVQVIHRLPLQEDLVDVLRDWHRQGISFSHVDLAASGAPNTLALPRAWQSGLSQLGRRFWSMLTLRRNPRGGFGGFVPEAKAGG